MLKTYAALVPLLLCLAAAPALAGTCHMTVQGNPVLDDVSCTLAPARRGEARVLVEGEGEVTVRRGILRARLLGHPRPDGSRRYFVRSFGSVVSSGASEGEDKACFFNERATLCVEP